MGRTVKASKPEELTPDQQAHRDEIRARLSGDFRSFAEAYLRIMDRDNPRGPQIIPFAFNACQRELDTLINRIKAFNIARTQATRAMDGRTEVSDLPVEVVAVKARKGGVSTYLRARQFWRSEFTPHLRSIVMAHEKKSSRTIAKIGVTFHTMWPKRVYDDTKKRDVPDIRIPIRRLSDDNMEWESEHGSSMVVQTAGSKQGTSRGDTYHFAHFSEYAHYPASDEVAATLNARVPYHETYYESTANGEGGEFYELARHSITIEEAEERLARGEAMPETWNGAFLFFWPWWKDPGYRLPLGPGEESMIRDSLSEREEELIELYDVDFEQLKFRRQKLRGECTKQSKMAPEDYWEQEYPSCLEDAFVAAGDEVFDRRRLSKMGKMAEDGRPLTYRPMRVSENNWVMREAVPSNATMWVFEPPRKGGKYVIGVDTAQGLKHGDWSVITVFDRTDGTVAIEVCRVRAKIQPSPLGELAVQIAMVYNDAFIVPEKNPPGNATCERIFNLGYTNVYIHKNPDLISSHVVVNSFFYGFDTKGKSRANLVDNGVRYMLDDMVVLRSPEAIQEWKIFSKIDGKAQAPEGECDDCVMADLLALHGAFVREAGAPPIFVANERPKVETPSWITNEDTKAEFQKLVEEKKKRDEMRTMRQRRLAEQTPRARGRRKNALG